MRRDEHYWTRVRQRAKELGTDGCTAALDVHLDCCYEHDIAFFTGATVDGIPRARQQANTDFRRCLQERSPFGVFSPMSWWRWAAVSLFGKGVWRE